MKRISKILALLLCLSLLFGTIGAGAAFAEDVSVVGTWTATVDLVEIMKVAAPDEAALFGDDPIYFDFSLIFDENGKVSGDVDLESALPAIKAAIGPMITSMIEDQFGMSAEDFEALTGMSIEDLVEQELNEEALMESFDLSSMNGTYTVEGNKVIIDGDTANAFTVDGDTMTIYVEELGGNIVFTRFGGETKSAGTTEPTEDTPAGNWVAEVDLLDILWEYGHTYSEFYEYDDFDSYDYYFNVYLLLGEDGSFRAFTDLDAVTLRFSEYMKAKIAEGGSVATDEALDEEYHLSEIVGIVNSYLAGKTWELSGDKLFVDGSREKSFTLEEGTLTKEIDGFSDVDFVRIPAVAGTWVAEINLQAFVYAWVDEDLAKYVDESETFDLVLNVSTFERYSIEARSDEIAEIVQKAVIDYGYAEHEDELADIEEEYGMSFEEVVKQEFSAEILREDIFWAFNWGSYYDVIDENTFSTYITDEPLKLDGDTLTTKDDDLGEIVFHRTPGIVGTWKGTMDVAKALAAADESLAEAIGEQSCEVEATFVFTEDGKYSCTIDFEAAKDDLKPLFSSLFAYVLEQQGTTAEELETMTGMTLDELIEEAFTEEALEEMMGTAQEGTYTMIGTLLFMDDNYDVACSWDGRNAIIQTLEGFGSFALTRVAEAPAA